MIKVYDCRCILPVFTRGNIPLRPHVLIRQIASTAEVNRETYEILAFHEAVYSRVCCFVRQNVFN